MSVLAYLPANETQRLEALRPYLQLPTRQAVFQAVTELTARLFGSPMAIMSLVEAREVQYPGNVGLPLMPERMPRTDCICSAAVYTATTTVFSDLSVVPCPWVHPGATGSLRFYAGHPLLTREGYAVGTLCVLDEHPHSFQQEEQACLRRMAGLAMRLLDLHVLLTATTDPIGHWTMLHQYLLTSVARVDSLTALAPLAGKPTPRSLLLDVPYERRRVMQELDEHISRAFALVEAMQPAHQEPVYQEAACQKPA